MTQRSTRPGGQRRPAPPKEADLDTHPVLAELDSDNRRAVLEHATVINVERDQLLFSEGDPARAFFLCRAGQLKLYRLAANGGEKIIGFVDAGSSFAEAAVFMQQATYPVHCQAVKASELVRIDAHHLIELLRHAPDSCIGLLGLISARLRNRVADIESLALHNGQLRVINYLLRLYREGQPIELPASKKSIAGFLAITPETLSRVLTQLQDAGAITVERRNVHVHDAQRLTAIAEGREEL